MKRSIVVSLMFASSTAYALPTYQFPFPDPSNPDSMDPTWVPPPPLPPEPQNPFDPPPAAGRPLEFVRTDTTIAFRWLDIADYETENVLERKDWLSDWYDLEVLGPQNGHVDYEDTDLEPETGYCYRIRTSNAYGTRWSGQSCAVTRDGTERGLSEAMLVFVTADIPDAGTDASFAVSLNTHHAYFEPSNHATYMDYPRYDHERGHGTTLAEELSGVPHDPRGDYHVSLTEIGGAPALDEISDITEVRLWTNDKDWWCIDEARLELNGHVHWVEEFDNQPNGCLWVGEGATTLAYFGELRAHPSWYGDALTQPNILNANLVSRISAIVGHAMHDTPLYWDGPHDCSPDEQGPQPPKGPFDDKDDDKDECVDSEVQVFFLDEKHLAVDVDVWADVTLSDPAIDIDFALEIDGGCDKEGNLCLEITPVDLDVDASWDALSWLAQIFACGYPGCAEGELTGKIEEVFPTDPISGCSPAPQICEPFPGTQFVAQPSGDIGLNLQ